MIYLLLAILSSCTISTVMRLSSKWVPNSYAMLCSNYLVCLIVSLIHQQEMVVLQPNITLGLGFLQGVLYLASFILFQRNVAQNGMILSSLFMKLGVVVPLLLSVLMFQELPSLIQLIGIILAMIAVVTMNRDASQTSNKFHYSLILLLIMGGLGDSMSKMFEYFGNLEESSLFLIYTFVFAFVLCFILCILKKEKVNVKIILFGIFIGIPNYYSAYFLLHALESVPAILAYPIYSIATLLLITIIGFVMFKERLKKQQIIGGIMIFIALYLLNC